MSWLKTEMLTKKKVANTWWTQAGVIPLGRKVYGHSPFRIVSLRIGLYDNNNILIFGGQGTGKSVLLKAIASILLRDFIVGGIFFDAISEEHYLSKYPNKGAVGLCPGINPFGLKGIVGLSPLFGGDRIRLVDRRFGFVPCDLDIKDWKCLDLPPGAARAIKRGIGKSGEYGEDFTKLHEFINSAPTSYQRAKRIDEEGFFVNPQSIGALLDKFENFKDDKLFATSEEDRLDPKEIPEMIRGHKHPTFSFYGEDFYSKAYVGVILKHLYYARRDGIIGPTFAFLEEAHKFAPYDDKKKEFGSTRWISDFVRLFRKEGLGVVSSTQKFTSLHEDVIDFFTSLIITGNLGARDLHRLGDVLNPDLVEVAKDLRYMPERGYREMMLVYPDRKRFDVFVPFNSPVRIFEKKEGLT